MLDHTSYPHILDTVIASAPPESLIALRRASRWLRDRVDRVLFKHICITEREQDLDYDVVLDITSPCGVVLPSFHGGVYFRDDEDTWSEPRPVADDNDNACAPVQMGAEHQTLLGLAEYIDFVPRKGPRSGNAHYFLCDCILDPDVVVRVFLDQDGADAECPMAAGQTSLVSMLTISTAQPSVVYTTPPPQRGGRRWQGVSSLILNVRYGPPVWAPQDTLVVYDWPATVEQVMYIFTYEDDDAGDVHDTRTSVPADHVLGFFRDLVRPVVGNEYVSYTFVDAEHALPRHLRHADFFQTEGPEGGGSLGQRVLVEALRLECEAWHLDKDAQKAATDAVTFVSRDEMREGVGEDMYAVATVWPDDK